MKRPDYTQGQWHREGTTILADDYPTAHLEDGHETDRPEINGDLMAASKVLAKALEELLEWAPDPGDSEATRDAIEARQDAQVRTLLKAGELAFAILGGAHELRDISRSCPAAAASTSW